MKTLLNVKDEVAQEFGYGDWDESYLWDDVTNSMIDEVAKRYAAEVAGEVTLICEEHSTGLHKEDALAITLNLINELK